MKLKGRGSSCAEGCYNSSCCTKKQTTCGKKVSWLDARSPPSNVPRISSSGSNMPCAMSRRTLTPRPHPNLVNLLHTGSHKDPGRQALPVLGLPARDPNWWPFLLHTVTHTLRNNRTKHCCCCCAGALSTNTLLLCRVDAPLQSPGSASLLDEVRQQVDVVVRFRGKHYAGTQDVEHHVLPAGGGLRPALHLRLSERVRVQGGVDSL